MNKDQMLLEMIASAVQEMRGNGQWGTAHVYHSAGNAFRRFRQGKDIAFADFDASVVKAFENDLRRRQCSWNTVSTYMKVLRAIYNRAIDQGLAPYAPRLFRHVQTAVHTERKKAMETGEIGTLLHADGRMPDAALQQARDLFRLMFLLRGMPFVDLAYLHKGDLTGDTIRYCRRKTGRPLTVRLTPEARQLIGRLANRDSRSPYLFPFLSSPEGSEAAYREYQAALRRLNRHLAVLRLRLGCDTALSTYTARHTWATMAYYCEVHPGIISEAMGHSSIAVTETYLKPFRNERIDAANREVIAFVQRQGLPDRHAARRAFRRSS